MASVEKLIEKARQGDSNLRFPELVAIVKSLGYQLARIKGSHQIYTCEGRIMINLQETKGKAKPYQVRQVLAILDGK